MPFSYRGETKEINELARQEASGSFVELTDGFTHYELSNPEVEDTVILVHGFTTPYFIYDPTFAFLTTAGFRVLRYDLFGRGFSDRPEISYDIHLFVRQLHDLLEALQITRPVSLVGLSMGGPISAVFTTRVPERVRRLVLIGPAGVRDAISSFVLKFITRRGIGETLLNLIGNGGVVRNMATDLYDRTYVEHFQRRYGIQMQYKGFKQAILSTVRSGTLGSFLEEYRRIGKMGLPVLLFWGRQDHTVPFHYSSELRQAIPQAEFHVIEHCGHIPHYEKPHEVNPILLRFLRGKS